MSALKELLQTFQPTENFDDDLSEFRPPLVPSNVDYLYCGAFKMFEAIMDAGNQQLQSVPTAKVILHVLLQCDLFPNLNTMSYCSVFVLTHFGL